MSWSASPMSRRGQPQADQTHVNAVPPHAPRRVGELMTTEPLAVRADATLADAGRVMEQNGFSGLPVVDAEGVLVGVISESDLLRARATEYLWASWPTLRVKNLMTSPALTVRTGDSILSAARRMERHHVSRLVVVGDADETHPVGIISISDLLRSMTAGMPDEDEPGQPEDEDVPSLPVVESPGD